MAKQLITVWGNSRVYLRTRARRIFSRGGQIGGLGRKSPSGVQGWNSGGVWGEALKSWRQVV